MTTSTPPGPPRDPATVTRAVRDYLDQVFGPAPADKPSPGDGESPGGSDD
jgi:hypothetical protein